MKIAIIGAGISGLTAAWLLHRRHDITLYEGAGRLGGHTATVDCRIDGTDHAVDTGFIVFNDRTYPCFNRLIDRLGVAWKNTEMGFSVTTRHGGIGTPHEGLNGYDFEYCGSDLGGLFADRRHLVSPAFLGMLRDILRFGRRARIDYESGAVAPGRTLGDYLRDGGYGDLFRTRYIIPMASAIWSASTARVLDFEARFFIRFFINHGLLNVSGRPQWRVIRNGSKRYIPPLVDPFRDRIRLNSVVRSVTRRANGVTVRTRSDAEDFDHVVLASHSDQSLAMLADASGDEREMLSAIPYSDNSVVLHTDSEMMPRRKRAWASWNYLLDGSEAEQPVLTYNMNILQGIESTRPICVTMNGDRHIDRASIVERFRYAHPQFGRHSVEAQNRVGEINGQQNTWFCGAWCGNGFHEDGVASAVAVASALGGDTL